MSALSTLPASLLAEDRWARLAISRLVEPGDKAVSEAIAGRGAPETAAALLRGDLTPTSGDITARIASLDLDAARHALEATDCRLVVPGDEEWPAGLTALTRPPYAIYVRGHPLVPLVNDSVALVGSRACTEYGATVAFELAHAVSGRGLTVVSGAAYGIDAAAHRGALGAGAPTVAVLACGLDRIYPSGHRALLAEIAATGAVLGEVPIGWAPLRWRFLARNRIIAAMTLGTVVVESGLRSGSQSTATQAFHLQRLVGAVPGPVTSATSAGCHQLIRSHKAEIVTDCADLLELMGKLGLYAPGPRRAASSPEAELEPVPYAVWSALPWRWTAPDRLVERCGLGLRDILPALRLLEDAGLAREGDAGWRKVRP